MHENIAIRNLEDHLFSHSQMQLAIVLGNPGACHGAGTVEEGISVLGGYRLGETVMRKEVVCCTCCLASPDRGK